MKLVTLNLWGGRLSDKLPEFFNDHKDIDIWCFQEVFTSHTDSQVLASMVKVEGYQANPHLFQSLQTDLPNHTGEFCQSYKGVYGLSIFTSPNIKIIDKGETLVAKGDWSFNPDKEVADHHRKIQWMEVEINNKVILLVNAHLTHRPAGKEDSEKRIKQSRIIIDLLEMFDCPKILVGDFNLLPNTESIKMFEKAGMSNLIKDYNIASTRTPLYKKSTTYADYIFVSKDIKVFNFQVMTEVVSDHTPLILDFEV
jgi:endonuclease/exonuclease/phosphatase family metal-dependent hydrolase